MTTNVTILKKVVKYIGKKDNTEKTATNFYLRCGDALVPIEVKFFANAETGKDTQYVSRKTLLSVFEEKK